MAAAKGTKEQKGRYLLSCALFFLHHYYLFIVTLDDNSDITARLMYRKVDTVAVHFEELAKQMQYSLDTTLKVADR